MNEIVNSLRRCGGARKALKESLLSHDLTEADEDEEVVDTPEEEEGEGIPPVEDTPSEEEEFVDPDGDTEKENQEDVKSKEEDSTEYVNPLDNPYAVKHTIGDEVILAYANGTNSKLKGQIDGYDKEGFYRIMWSNGLTTNGITDLALADLVKATHESKCVCGHTHFVNEGKYVVCDNCGRRIRESEDVLKPDDKSKKRNIIRAEQHPMTTATRPNISETIKNAFKKSPVRERWEFIDNEDEDDEEEVDDTPKIPDIFYKLYNKLNNQFWTRLPELVQDIEELGYEVLDSNLEYLVIIPDPDKWKDYDKEYYIPLAGTSRTLTLDFDRAELR